MFVFLSYFVYTRTQSTNLLTILLVMRLQIDIMEKYADAGDDIELDDLDPSLAYHISLMDVLAGCTVGRLNITTIEAKVQR